MPEFFTDTDGQRYELVNPQLVSYPIERTVIEAGKKVITVSRVRFMVVSAKRVK